MSIRTYALLAEGVLAKVRSTLEQAVGAWALEWGLAAPAVACLRAWEVPALHGCRTRVSADDATAWLGWPDALQGVLQRMMFAPDRDHGQSAAASLAAAAAGAALEALEAALAGAVLGPAHGRTGATNVQAEARSTGSGAVLAEVRFERHVIGVLLDHAAVMRLAGNGKAPGKTLPPADYHALLADQPVTLAVKAGRATVSIGSLVALAPGDVIRLDSLADRPMAASIADGAVLLRGYLGTRDNHLALDLAAGDVPSGEQA